MPDLFRLFDPTGFPPRWTCGTGWTRPLGWSHIGSDIVISLAYFAVPCVVLHFVSRRDEVKFPRSFWILLTLIFVSCGLVHLFESVIFWWPVYRLSAALKLITAVVSCSGVVLLFRVLPTVLLLKHPDELQREVAERRRAETELNEERFLLNTLLDQLPDAIYFKDVNCKFVRVSSALAKRLSCESTSEVVGRSDFDFFSRAYAEQTFHDERALMASRRSVIGKEERPRWPDGTESWVSTTKSPLISADGHLLGTMGISHDVTELKAREAALQLSEERYELAVRGSTDGLWDWDTTSGVVYYSARFKELLGFQEHEFPNLFSSFETRLHPDDHEPTLAAVRAHLDHRAPYDVEYRLLTRAGHYRWYRARGQAIWNEDGKPGRMAGSISDVTDRRQAEERFRLAVEASPSGMLIADRQGRILLANSQIEKLFGFPREELTNMTIEDLVPEAVREKHLELRAGYFADPQPRPMGSGLDLQARRRDGSLFDVEIGLSPLHAEQELTVLCSILDVTQRKKTIRALQEARQVAEAASRAKSGFLANMSHEIRTPMNAIIGMTELVLDTKLTRIQRDYLSTVAESADSLLATINEILDFSRIEAGHVALESVPFSLRELLGDTLKAVSVRAHARGLELAWRVATEVPDGLRGDPTRIRQILINLTGNAIKFTNDGEVVVNVTATELEGNRIELQVSVRDTGIGIPENRQKEIFDAFAQADMTTTRKYGGTGLGLSIASSLTALMGGHISLQSEVGSGTIFTFTVCLERAEEGVVSRPDRPHRLGELTVLVVDDNATNRLILTETLEGWGARVRKADSGTAALALLRNSVASSRRIDLIITDVQMPGMDGYDFLTHARSMPECARTPVLVLTSGQRDGDGQRAESLGVVAQLTKPVKQSELLDAISEAVGAESVGRPLEADEAARKPLVSPLRILLVEDSLVNQKLAMGILSRWGHEVMIAADGQAAIDRWESGEFDLVLMDVNMPVLDGLEATREIRRREAEGSTHVPIVAMTAHALKGDRERCLEAGMDDYLSKPIRRSELNRVIARVVRKAAPVPPADGGHGPVVPVPAELQRVDWNTALQAMGSDRQLLEVVVAAALEELPWLMQELEQATATGDAQAAGRAAHTLRGCLHPFGVDHAVSLAGTIEQVAEGGSLTGLDASLAELRTHVDGVIDELRRHAG